MEHFATERFAIAFAAAQLHVENAARTDLGWLQPYSLRNANEELQRAFDALPESVQVAIMKVDKQLIRDRQPPEIRPVNKSD